MHSQRHHWLYFFNIEVDTFMTLFRTTIQSLCLLATMLAPVQAATLLGIASPRNAADLLSGANRLMETHPQHHIMLRTTEQFLQLSDAKRRLLLQQADVVFAGGVFGEPVAWLNKYVDQTKSTSVFLAVHSDRNLVKRSHAKGRPLLSGADIDSLMTDPPLAPDQQRESWSRQQLKTHGTHRDWLLTKIFWSNRDRENMDGMLRQLLHLAGVNITVPEPKLRKPLRIIIDGVRVNHEQYQLNSKKTWVAVLDYETGDRPGERELHEQLCGAIEKSGQHCVRVLAKWGEASVIAIDWLSRQADAIAALVSLQNFVVGGGDGRKHANEALAVLNVPVLKGIRLSDSSRDEWLLSEEGLRSSTVHYRVAMPELQAVIEPLVVAAMAVPSIDKATGLKLARSEPIESQVSLLAHRLDRWITLQKKAIADKKVAIIYYNHPPGRHNIGADNLNVPASLFHILQQLKIAGYDTGPLPKSEQELLNLLQARGVNLPEDRQALTAMAKQVSTVSTAQYQQWFEQLPQVLQQEMIAGPLGYLHSMLQRAIHLEDRDVGRRLLTRVVEDLHHAIDGADHPARERVSRLLEQLEASYTQSFDGVPDWAVAQQLVTAIADSGIEGLRGWGELPGKVMVHANKILIPGLQFGNIFIGPQPPRGWELNEELLHANLSFPPPHQYVAFYQWLRHSFAADAVVHLGRHSTYEFLPRHRVGLSEEDYSLALLGDLPSVYPYIVDGVGEGIQAKRRGFAVMVDHLTPPLDSTELYDQLLELRQLVESYEAAPDSASAMRERAMQAIKALVDELQLADELVASMAGELAIRGFDLDKTVDLDQIDDELLVHEIGHYLTKLQEDFMPLGLHVFGRDWSQEAVSTMLSSMAQGKQRPPQWQALLTRSPAAEMNSLLKGLVGQYILPGKGNDPIRTPEALPTGRNFFALDGSLIPSRLGYQVGVELAVQARQRTEPDGADALVLWASDVVRDEGAMIAFGFDMLGVKPTWSSRGTVTGLTRIDIRELTENEQPRIRRDAVFTTSGLFRDLYGSHMILLERAVLMALDASSALIHKDYPALGYALNTALEPLGVQQQPGYESLQINHVAARWVKDAQDALKAGVEPALAGRQAAYRVFGDAPGSYGAGVNRLVERSGSWQHRSEIAQVYMRRMGHVYGLKLHGEPVLDTFKQRLSTINKTYLGRASNLYGLLDNNDTFDYLGGLSLAVETVKGQAPENFVIFHPDANNLTIEPLQVALLSELRGRFLNPQWLNPLMKEGYAGARTMGSEFFEYLWGWQVTNPDIVKSWVWDEVKAVYIDDKLNIELDAFLQQGHNVHVKSNMLAVMLVAAQKGFWQTDQKTLQQLAEQFATLVLENGLPGSGHTRPDHPLYQWLQQHLAEQQYAQLQQLLDATRVDGRVEQSANVIAEITLQQPEQEAKQYEQKKGTASKTDGEKDAEEQASADTAPPYWLVLLALLLLITGGYRGSRPPIQRGDS